MVWPPLRDFLQVPSTLTGRGSRIAIIDGNFPSHPDITSNEQRRSFFVRALAPDAQPQPFDATPGPWPGGSHGLWAAAAGAGSGAQSGGLYAGLAPEADLFLIAADLPGQPFDVEDNMIAALRWVLEHGQDHGIQGVQAAIVGKHDSGLLPWQAEPQRVWCEALADAGVLVVAACGNSVDLTASATQAAAPSVLSVGGVIIPEGGVLADARPYYCARGITFDGKTVPDILAPAANLVLPHGTDDYLSNHFYAQTDVLPAGYARMEGTSYAGPIVLGAAACVWQAHPEWSAWQMREALVQTATQAPQWASLKAGTVSVAGAVAYQPTSVASVGSNTPYARWRAWRQEPLAVRLQVAQQDSTDSVDALLAILPNDLPADQVDTVRRLAQHLDPRLRTAALCVLATQPDQLTPADVLPMLKDSDVYVRNAALYTLGRCPHLWEAALPRLIELFVDPSLDIRYCAFRLASQIKHLDFIEPLIAGLEDDAHHVYIENWGQRGLSLTAITGVTHPSITEWYTGPPSDSKFTLDVRLKMSAQWRDWFATYK